MIRVFAYLAWRSAHNRIVRQLRHLRSPRYLAALLLGLAYLWFMVVGQRPAGTGGQMQDPRLLELIGAAVLIGMVAWGWIFGVERRVLAFTPAEVTFLFSGPVSRRGLIQFKLLHSQVLILFNALLWTLILSRERLGTSSWLRVISIWILLTTLSLHRLGASFVRTSLSEHGRLGARHRIVSLLVVGLVLVAVTWSIADALPALVAARGEAPRAFLAALQEAASRPLPSMLMYPFRALLRPLAAHNSTDWLQALWPALLLLVLHYVWVVRSDSAFEETAAEFSLQRARALAAHRGRASGSFSVPRTASRPLFRLAPVGWPAGAILWKNLVAVTRTRRVRNAAVALAAAGAVVAFLSFNPEGTLAEIAGWLAASWGLITIVIGPQWVRNDLRGDLLKLDLLRSYPLRGWSVVIAEVAASTLMLTAIQLGLLAIAYLAFLGNQTMTPDLKGRTLLLLAAVVYLPGINLLSMLIQNAAALLYPGWVRLGSGRAGGVEALGQNLLMMVAFVALLALTLALPAALAGGSFLLLRPVLDDWAALPATVLALGTMAFEAALMVEWLGGVFERTDPATAGIGGSY
jgi:ABC-2 type transport system permease protein